jgi:hypothetical protein
MHSLNSLCKSGLSSRYVYIGHFLSDMMQGNGVVITPMGIYKGEWHQGLFHGHGTAIFGNSKYYSGSWAEGAMHGFGISDSYEGCRMYGLRCGVGADNHYTGEFKDDKYDGYGVLSDDTGQYEGGWRNGVKHGACIFKTPKGGEFLGNYDEGKMSGYGVMRFAKGERYEGYWSNNAFHGEGTFYSRDGTAYAGQYVEGASQNYGHFYINQGFYTGELQDRRPHGVGTLISHQGLYGRSIVIYKGAWSNGKKCGYGTERRQGGRYEGH